MDGASDGVSVAIASRASAALGAGRVSQPQGSPARLVGSAGRSTASHIDPSWFPSGWGGRVQPDRAAVPCLAAPPNPLQRVP